jgi:translation elongation factor EF-Ts
MVIYQAVDYLREKGLAQAAKRMDREAKEGLVTSYIHAGGRIGVLVEVNCETDFVARTEEFQSLVNDIAMQIAALSARYVQREDVPQAVLEHECQLYRAQALEEGKLRACTIESRGPYEQVLSGCLPAGAVFSSVTRTRRWMPSSRSDFQDG